MAGEVKLFCKLPFGRISIDDDGNVWPACCPDWVQFPLGNIFKQSWDEVWYGEAATRFRESMFDGSLRFCNKNWCPNVADALTGIDNYHVVPLKKAPTSWAPAPPIHVNLNYDQTCNLRCPSCRTELVHMQGADLEKVQYIQRYAEEHILPGVESIAMTGVGDPFMSRVFRNFLINFDAGKYPKLKTIHFHTNGQLFDEKMYEKMKGLHHLNIATDISIDAASADIYRQVRPPGDWNRLMRNLQFIKQLDNLVLLGISMVVQPLNYRQMPAFIELAETLVYKKRETFVEFKRPRQYSPVPDEMFKQIDLERMSPAMQEDFLQVLQQVEAKRQYNAKKHIYPDIRHNLHEFLPPVLHDTSTMGRFSSFISKLIPAR